MKKTRLMRIKKEFEITHSYEYDKRLERKKNLFFFSIERLLETKVKDEGLGDIITQCFLKYFSKGNPEEIPYQEEQEPEESTDSENSDHLLFFFFYFFLYFLL